MRKVLRDELDDYMTYTDRRDAARAEAIAAKDLRRVQVGENLTFLFENHVTIRYQIQEMMRVEQLVRESDVQHELDTYNALIGDDGALGCTLLIGIDDPEERQVKLAQWLTMPERLYVELEDGAKVRATYDDAQIGDDRLSAVQYLAFDTGGRVPVAMGVDHEHYVARTPLAPEQRAALREDLAGITPAG